jgi:ATP-binding cassette, subfamily B, bacterial IrtA/YbtP
MISETLKALIKTAGKQKKQLTLASILAVVSALFALVPFIIIYFLATAFLESSVNPTYFTYNVVFALVSAIICWALRAAAGTLSHKAAFNIQYDLRIALIEKLGKVPMGYFNSTSSGTIKKVLNEDVERLELFIAHHLPDLVVSLSLPIIMVSFLFTVDWRMALVVLIPLPLAFVAQMFVYRGSETKMQEYHNNLEKMNSVIVEYVNGMPVIKVFNQTVTSFARYKESVERYFQQVSDWIHDTGISQALFVIVLESGLIFLIPIGTWWYFSGSLSLPTLLLFLILGISFIAPLSSLIFFGGMFSMNLEGMKRIKSILNEPELIEPKISKMPTKYSVEFSNVHFSYNSNEVLKGVSFIAEEGTITAFIGPSGAGKTTAAQLIPRFWDVKDGAILIGGVNIKDIPINELMAQVSFVFQDVFLSNDTIHNNIAMGNPNATTEKVIAAAKIAQCNDFICALPKGYDTVIGEHGSHLSGGERQRLSLARAILKDAPIIILDEATAFADPENEGKIQQALSALMKEKTVIVIAHRLTTITEANQIIVFQAGQVAGCGTHQSLMNSCKVYQRMWQTYQKAKDWTLGSE